jgi:hypothetical protein
MKVTRPKATISVRKVTNKKAVATPVKIEVMNLRLQKDCLYLGETDPAQFIHSNKTHRSVSEAFRDADYATPIWRCENDWDRTKEYLAWAGMWVILLSALYLLATWFEGVM